MVLKRPFISDTGEASTYSLFRSCGRSFDELYDSFTHMMVLKRPFVIISGRESAGCLFFSSHRRENFELIGFIYLQDGLEKAVHQ